MRPSFFQSLLPFSFHTVESALLDGLPATLALDPADAAAGCPAGTAAAASLLRCIASSHAPPLTDGRSARAAAAAAAGVPLATGIPGLDALLGGGLRRGWTVELAGPAGSGKTQVCLAAAAATAVALPQSRTLFLHSGSAFPATRLAGLVRRCVQGLGGGGDSSDVAVHAALSRVTVIPVASLAGVGAALDAAATSTSPASSLSTSSPALPPPFTLIILDSLAAVAEVALLRSGGGGPAASLAPATQGRACLLATGRQAKAFAAATGAALLLTNTATEWGQAGSGPPSWRPGLGEGWAPVPHVRVLLEPPVDAAPTTVSRGSASGGPPPPVAGPPRLAHLLAGPPPKDGSATTAAWRVPGEE